MPLTASSSSRTYPGGLDDIVDRVVPNCRTAVCTGPSYAGRHTAARQPRPAQHTTTPPAGGSPHDPPPTTSHRPPRSTSTRCPPPPGHLTRRPVQTPTTTCSSSATTTPPARTPSLSPPGYAPQTTRLRIVPEVPVTHTEPFHVATSTATLDYAASGRAGWSPVARPRMPPPTPSGADPRLRRRGVGRGPRCRRRRPGVVDLLGADAEIRESSPTGSSTGTRSTTSTSPALTGRQPWSVKGPSIVPVVPRRVSCRPSPSSATVSTPRTAWQGRFAASRTSSVSSPSQHRSAHEPGTGHRRRGHGPRVFSWRWRPSPRCRRPRSTSSTRTRPVPAHLARRPADRVWITTPPTRSPSTPTGPRLPAAVGGPGLGGVAGSGASSPAGTPPPTCGTPSTAPSRCSPTRRPTPASPSPNTAPRGARHSAGRRFLDGASGRRTGTPGRAVLLAQGISMSTGPLSSPPRRARLHRRPGLLRDTAGEDVLVAGSPGLHRPHGDPHRRTRRPVRAWCR